MDAEQQLVVADSSEEPENAAIQASLIVTLEDATVGPDSSHNYEEDDSNMVPVQFVLDGNESQQPVTEAQNDESHPSELTPVEAEYVDQNSLQYENTESTDLSEQKDVPTESQVESLLSAVPFPHQSILRYGNEIPVLDLSEEVFHCALCPETYPAWESKEAAAEHFKTSHWEAKLTIDDDVNVALCCCSSHTAPHYHCPYCGGVQEEVSDMTAHIASCIHTVLSQQEEPAPTEPTPEATPDKPPDKSPAKKPDIKQHKSLVRALSDVRLKVCRRCCRGTRYHCPFCPDVLCKPQSVNKIKHHLLTTHWKFNVPYEDKFILKCTSACLGAVNGRPLGAHWHCPICAQLMSTRQVMRSHLHSHTRGTAHRHRTNAEWAKLMGPEHANLLFNSKKKGSEQAVERLMNSALEGNDQAFTPRETYHEKGEAKQVFQTVAALLTRDMLAAIPGSVSAYFSTLQDTTDSNLQFSTSDQWCLLQADWRTMSGVHEQLTSLLSHSETNKYVSLVKSKQDVVPSDLGAGGDGLMNQEMPDVPESDITKTEENPMGDAVPSDAVNALEMYPQTDHQDDADTETETKFPEPSPVTSENNTTQEEGYSILVSELQGITSDNTALPVIESGHSAEKVDGEESVDDTNTVDQIDSSLSGETEKTSHSQNEQSAEKCSTSLESSPIPNTPVKRGRGRPPKVLQSKKEPLVIQPIEPVAMKVEDSPEPTSRRRISKLPKRYQDYDTFSTDMSENVKDTSEPVQGPVVATVPPVKRGRGRPRKHPRPLELSNSGDDAEWTNCSVSKKAHTTSVKASVRTVEDSESSDEDAAGDNSKKDARHSALTKRQKISGSDPPAITIAIDETTGNVISVAVAGDDATTEEDKIKKEEETNENQLPDEMDIEDICLSNGITLVRPKKFVICEACDKTFPDHHRFYQHVLGSSCIEKRLKRDKNFKLSLELDLVIREVEKEVTEPKCPLCQREFKFLLHAKMHYAEKTCTKPSMRNLEVLEKDQDTGLYHCRHCRFSHEGMRRVIEHEMRKHWKKTLPCPICSKKYSCETYLREHIKAVHAKGKERAVCDQCGVEVTARLLRQHIKYNHDPTYVRPKPKPITEPISCHDCDFKTMSYSKLARHRTSNHREQDKQCPHCEQKFAMMGDLNRHVRAVHLGQNQVSGKCPECGKTMAKKNIAAHIKMVHEKRRPHSCYICGRAFLTKHTLKMHMVTHQPADQKDTRYLCAFCGKGFSHRTHYQDHLNTHTGARPYTCNVCNKTFRCNPALHKHKELHRTINLHCDICNLHFPNRKALRIHNNKEHLNSTAMCRCVCDAEYNSRETLAQHQLICGQWQQANPQDNPHVTHAPSDLENQMAVILQQAAANGDADGSSTGTYIVLEGKEGDETVMVLQSIDGVEGASVLQSVTGSDIMTVTQPGDNGEGTESEVLLSPEDALTMAASQADITISMDTDNQGLLTLQQDVDSQQPLPVAEGGEEEDQQEVGDMNRYLCGYCQKLFTSLEDVQTHMMAEHVAAEGGEVELALHNPADDTDVALDEVTADALL